MFFINLDLSKFINSPENLNHYYQNFIDLKSQLQTELSNPGEMLICDHNYYCLLIGFTYSDLNEYDITDPIPEMHLKKSAYLVKERFLNLFSDEILKIFYSSKCKVRELKDALTGLNDFESIDCFYSNPQWKAIYDNKGIPQEEVEMFIYAIRFYTGGVSMMNNRELAYDIREAFLKKNQFKPIRRDLFLLNSYMLKGLSHLPIFTGVCIRCANINLNDMCAYSTGNIVTWVQFSSCTEGTIPNSEFANRNCEFIIYSQTARKVSLISKFPQEKEVIFLPFSQFLVYKVDFNNIKPKFYLRQIELGIGKKNVLWIDDQVFDDDFQSKSYIEYSATINPQIRFIMKNSNESAFSYLESPWGKKHLNDIENFRIIMSLSRPGDVYANDSGIQFCNYVQALGYSCKMMIYTEYIEYTYQVLETYGLSEKQVAVCFDSNEIISFISFTS